MRQAFWESSWLWLGLALLAALPFSFVSVPPLVDLPGHIGRYHIALELDRSPYLERYYGFEWALIGNLGVDLLVMPLGRLVGVERAVWLIAAAIPPLTVVGIWAVARTLHGRVPPTAPLALIFVFSYPFFYGFLNYVLSAALALLAFALWVRLRDRSTLRAALFVPIAFLIWLCHVSGWGVLGLLVGGYEVAKAPGIRTLPLHVARRVWPLLSPLPLILIWRSGGGGGVVYAGDWIRRKAVWLLSAVRHDNMAVEIGLVLIVGSIAAWLVATRRVRFLPALAVPALLLAIAWAAMPTSLFRSYYADMRLTPVMLTVGILALAWSGRRGAAQVALAGIALFIAQVAMVSWSWTNLEKARTSHLAALRYVPKGSRILVLMPGWRCNANDWRLDGLSHLADLAVVRRDAFVNSGFAIAGSQLLTVRYNRDTAYYADPSQFVRIGGGCGGSHNRHMEEVLDDFPRDRFDFVWFFRTSERLPRLPADLRRLYADGNSALFRVSSPAVRRPRWTATRSAPGIPAIGVRSEFGSKQRRQIGAGAKARGRKI